MRRRPTPPAASWVTDDARSEAEIVLAERLDWARALGYSELLRRGAHEWACEVLGDSPVHVLVEVHAYEHEHGWSDALARGELIVNEDNTFSR